MALQLTKVAPSPAHATGDPVEGAIYELLLNNVIGLEPPLASLLSPSSSLRELALVENMLYTGNHGARGAAIGTARLAPAPPDPALPCIC